MILGLLHNKVQQPFFRGGKIFTKFFPVLHKKIFPPAKNYILRFFLPIFASRPQNLDYAAEKREKIAARRRNFPLAFFMSTFYNVATKWGEVGESVKFSTSIPGKGAGAHDRGI